jgi:hypothetical protein
MLKTHVENISRLNSLNIKRMQTLSATILLHSNRDQDGINNNSEITKVSTQVITIIHPTSNNHP